MNGVKFYLKDGSKFAVKDSKKQIKEVFPSDLIFSSIICNVDLIYGEKKADEIVKEFKKGNLKISSMMMGLDFFHKDTNKIEKTLYFFPKPEAMIQKEITIKEDKLQAILKYKKSKKVKMISINALQALGKTWDERECKFNYNLSDLVQIGKDYVCTKEDIEGLELNLKDLESISFGGIDDRVGIKVNRNTDFAENLYYREEKIFKYMEIRNYIIKPFLYFLYYGIMPLEVHSAINLMVDEGLGGNRSIGVGTFLSNEFIKIDAPTIYSPNIYMNLSTYMPLKKETKELIGYKLEKRDGYMYYKGGQPYRKKSMNIVIEGALVSNKVEGNIANVTPIQMEDKISVYLYGKAFLMPLGGDEFE